MEFLLAAAYSLIFGLIIWKWRFFKHTGLSRRFLIIAFAIKLIAGFSIYALYSSGYEERSKADTFKFYDDSEHLFHALKEAPSDYFFMLTGLDQNREHFQQYYDKMNNWNRDWETGFYNDSQTMIRLNAFFRLFSFNQYAVHIVFMCFISFIGMMALFRGILPFASDRKYLFTGAIFLIPSVVFWTSGVLKESLLIFGLGLLVYAMSKLYYKRLQKVKYLGILVIALFLIFITKIYILFTLAPGLLAFFIGFNIHRKRTLLLIYGMSIFLILGVGSQVHRINPNYHMGEILAQKQRHFKNAVRGGVYLQKDDRFIYVPDNQREKLVWEGKNYGIREGETYKYFMATTEHPDTLLAKGEGLMGYYKVYDDEAAGSQVFINDLNGSYQSLIKATPRAWLNTFILPLPTSKKVFMALSGFENLILLLAMAALIIHRRKKNSLSTI